MSPSPPTKDRSPSPGHVPGCPRGRSGISQETWGALSSDSLPSSDSEPRSPSGVGKSLLGVFASQGLCPWRRLSAPVSTRVSPGGIWLGAFSVSVSASSGRCLGLYTRPLSLRLALGVSLAQVSNTLTLAPLASLLGSLPLGLSLPLWETGKPRPGLERRQQVQTPPTPAPQTPGVPCLPAPSPSGRCRFKWEGVEGDRWGKRTEGP